MSGILLNKGRQWQPPWQLSCLPCTGTQGNMQEQHHQSCSLNSHSKAVPEPAVMHTCGACMGLPTLQAPAGREVVGLGSSLLIQHRHSLRVQGTGLVQAEHQELPACRGPHSCQSRCGVCSAGAWACVFRAAAHSTQEGGPEILQRSG